MIGSGFADGVPATVSIWILEKWNLPGIYLVYTGYRPTSAINPFQKPIENVA